MFAALSETNEAIMRARTRAELFHLVCGAAVHGGEICRRSDWPGAAWLRFSSDCSEGRTRRARARKLRNWRSHGVPEGRGVSGTAFRTRAPCISNDYLADERGTVFSTTSRAPIGGRGAPALPLLSQGEACRRSAFSFKRA